jgi:hypothetical protein
MIEKLSACTNEELRPGNHISRFDFYGNPIDVVELVIQALSVDEFRRWVYKRESGRTQAGNFIDRKNFTSEDYQLLGGE